MMLLLALAACAPGALGTSPTRALPAPVGETVSVEAGSEVYLRRLVPLADLGMRAEDLQGLFWVPSSVDSESADVSHLISFEPDQLPPGWRFELAQVRIEREIETLRGEDTGRTFVDIAPVFRLSVPAGASLGAHEIGGTLVHRQGTEQRIEIQLRVRAPG